MRKHYLDNIRWTTVLLVLFYHVFYMFNNVGVLGGIPNAKNIPFFDGVASLIYPWFMVLLFVVSGLSAKYALDKRTSKEFIGERTRKLLVPSTLGLFVVHWIVGYLNIRIGGGLEYIPKALIYPISVISGIGPLWFIQMLFVFSCVLVLIKRLDKKDRVWTLCKKANTPFILSIFVLIFLSAQFLNVPVLTMYRFGIYFVSFAVGYFVFSHESVQDIIEKTRWCNLGLAIIFGIWYAVMFFGADYTSKECLQNIITNMYLWFMVLVVFGFAKRYFNKANAFTDYMTKASFGIYILHYPTLISICFVLYRYFELPAIWNYGIALVLQIVLTFVFYEVIRRIPGIRYLVLGIRGDKNADKTC